MHILSYMKLKFSLEPYRELSLKQQKKKTKYTNNKSIFITYVKFLR